MVVRDWAWIELANTSVSFATLLLMWLLSGDTGAIRAILEWRPLRWVGLISYSLYIWQQLFLEPQSPFRTTFPFNICLAILAAMASYYLVESPLRTKIRHAFERSNTSGAPVR